MEVAHLVKMQGLYLVVASIMPENKMLDVVEKALKGGVDIIQFVPRDQGPKTLQAAEYLRTMTAKFNVPFLINGNLLLANKIKADGLHFDNCKIAPEEARRIVGKHALIGYTLGKDLMKLEWAQTEGANYVSFCSVFPTTSGNQCGEVPLETVRVAKSRTSLSVFAAGGINQANAHFVLETGADGIVVTSAILKSKDPERAASLLKEIVQKSRLLGSEF